MNVNPSKKLSKKIHFYKIASTLIVSGAYTFSYLEGSKAPYWILLFSFISSVIMNEYFDYGTSKYHQFLEDINEAQHNILMKALDQGSAKQAYEEIRDKLPTA